MVIAISSSHELAAEHPGFMAGCAERGHQVEVFTDSHERPESDGAQKPDRDDVPGAGHIGEPGRRA
jgi:hypothetical protein